MPLRMVDCYYLLCYIHGNTVSVPSCVLEQHPLLIEEVVLHMIPCLQVIIDLSKNWVIGVVPLSVEEGFSDLTSCLKSGSWLSPLSSYR